MRIHNKFEGIQEGDLTPMIDMTFQLIAFFMVLINFSQTETHEEIMLPKSVLAKPPEQPLEDPLVIQLTAGGQVIFGGYRMEMEALNSYLVKEATGLQLMNKALGDSTIIIRAHRDSQAGKVQELIQVCQENRFEKFALRAEEKVEY